MATPSKKLRPDVAEFIERLEKAPKSKQAQITTAEIEELRSRLSLQSLKVYLSLRRTAVHDRFGAAHPAYDMLRLTDEDYAKLNADYQERVSARQSEPIRVKHTMQMIDTARALLVSEDPHAVTLGLALTTGRRIFELVANPDTDFEFVTLNTEHGKRKERWLVKFRGQAKTKGAENTMAHKVNTIPVLAPAEVVIEAFHRLRTRLAPNWVGLDYDASNAATAVPLNRRVKAIFGPFWPSGNTSEEELEDAPQGIKARGKAKSDARTISVRDLRPLYGEICSRMFNKTGTAEEMMKSSEYLARILGHRENDLTTAQSYHAFVLEDLPGVAPAAPVQTGGVKAKSSKPAKESKPTAVVGKEATDTLGLTKKQGEALVAMLPDRTFNTRNYGMGEVVPKEAMHNSAFTRLERDALLEKRLGHQEVEKGEQVTITTWGLSPQGRECAVAWSKKLGGAG